MFPPKPRHLITHHYIVTNDFDGLISAFDIGELSFR